MKSMEDATRKLKRAGAGAIAAALGAAGAYYGVIFFGIMDYLYQPECFRAGERPRPSSDTAPGRAEITPEQTRTTDCRQAVTLRFIAGPGGISEDGGIKIAPCHITGFSDGSRRADFQVPFGWGILQNTRPKRPNFCAVELKSHGNATLEMERMPGLPIRFGLRVLAREWMRRRGSKLDPLDYGNLLLEQSKVKIKVRGGRLDEGDEVTLTVGGQASSAWKIPELPARADFLVEVDEKTLGRYRLIEELPSLVVLGEPAVSL